jgi:molybdopterin/thiamine biosynthesis adenylyltransferase
MSARRGIEETMMDHSPEFEKTSMFGRGGVERLKEKTAAVVGLGALGSISSLLLSRFPLKKLILVDRDIVEMKNLFRQYLYTIEDAEERLPKARAARSGLEQFAQTKIEARDVHLGSEEAKSLFEECDIVIDATDNFETRFLMNEASVFYKKPWIYGGVLGTRGSMLFIEPQAGPCLKCVFSELPAVGAEDSCDSAGIHPSLPMIIASMQAAEAGKYLSENENNVEKSLVYVDIDESRFTKMKAMKDGACKCCGASEFEFMDDDNEDEIRELCGSGSVLIILKHRKFDLYEVGKRLEKEGTVFSNPFLVELKKDEATITVHSDGRVLVHGISEGRQAMSVVSRVLGL